MSPEALKHGIRREVYAVQLASNAMRYLRGETNEPCLLDMPTKKVGTYFKERWMVGRALRKPDYLVHTRPAVLKAIYAGVNADTREV